MHLADAAAGLCLKRPKTSSKNPGRTQHIEITDVEAVPIHAQGEKMEKIRLNKVLAQAGICSRRKADQLIEEGRVTVNGKITAELGMAVLPGRDDIRVDGKLIRALPGKMLKFTYIMLHKPVQVVCTVKDPQGRQTVMDLLPEDAKAKRLYPVGRLDYFSEGLLLLTDDGELTNKITHPRHHLPRVYQVRLREKPTSRQLEVMRGGMTLAEGEKLAPVEVDGDQEDPRLLTMILHQGVNRQIRRMCRDLSLTVLRLTRTAIGPLQLGILPKGAARPLSVDEIAALKKAVGIGSQIACIPSK